MKKAQLAGILGLSLLAVSTAVAQQPQPQGQAGPSASENIRTLSKGTGIKLKLQDQISSQTNKAGDIIKAAVDGNVKDATGGVIFSEGAQAEVEVVNTAAGYGLALKTITSVGQKYRLKTSSDFSTGVQAGGANAAMSGGVSAGGNMGAVGQRDSATVGITAQAGAQGSGKVWNIFKDQENGLGVVSGVKEPPLGGDFVIPPGSTVKFDFKEPVTLSGS
jgi:hypothetical protein